ncbi:MAG: hypothetical protein AAFS10_27500, partial [Myxococcota bacterium]
RPPPDAGAVPCASPRVYPPPAMVTLPMFIDIHIQDHGDECGNLNAADKNSAEIIATNHLKT